MNRKPKIAIVHDFMESFGGAERVEQRTPEKVLKSADQALYSAKGAGRNCVMAFGQNRRGAVRMDAAAVE